MSEMAESDAPAAKADSMFEGGFMRVFNPPTFF